MSNAALSTYLSLFGKSPQEKVSQATVHCGRFKQETVIIDDALVKGTAIEQIEDVMDFIRKNTNVRFEMTGEPRRREVWDYPLEALREVVINAVCHREYGDNADIQLKIYDNRLTVPQNLPKYSMRIFCVCFLLQRYMTRRPQLILCSAARGISTGVTSRGTRGREILMVLTWITDLVIISNRINYA